MTGRELLARLRYEFDKSMAAGTVALIGWLALISLVLIIIAGAVIALAGIAPEGGERLPFLEALWASLMRTLDAGTMGADAGWPFRIVMLLVTIGGIFVVSTLIGVLASGIEGRLEQLRRGRSRVLESDHTLILNWSPSIFDIIAELVVANASRKRPRIVIMAAMDKVEMEEEIARKAGALGNTRIICRSGDPTDLFDLQLASPQTSRSIIVLSPPGDDPDSQVIKTVLALTHGPERRAERYRIVAEIRNAQSGELALAVGGNEVQLVLADELIGRIVVHSSRQSGLSAVYSELLDFDGSEIYLSEQPALAGNSFGDSLMAYNTSTLIGIADGTGKVFLNPPMDTEMQPGFRAIFIAEDDGAIRIEAETIEVDMAAVAAPEPLARYPERTLMLGWNRRAPIIIRELSRYVQPNSMLTVAADIPDLAERVSAVDLSSGRLEVEFGQIDTTRRDAIEALDIGSYDHLLVLGYSDDLPPQVSDTRTLVTLLHLRRIAEAQGRHVNVVSEMIDVRNRELAEVTRADDFVVSNRLVSQMLAQASENEQLAAIFGDLLDDNGSEFYMRPAGNYVVLDRPVSFYTVVEAARRRGEVAVGYLRRPAENADRRNPSGVVVNPRKADRVSFAPEDRVIVLARE